MTLESFSKRDGIDEEIGLINSDGFFGWWCVMLTKVMVLKIIWFWSLYMVVLSGGV